MIARHLGHNKVQTTARYAHLARDSVKTAGERVAVSLAAEFRGVPRLHAVACCDSDLTPATDTDAPVERISVVSAGWWTGSGFPRNSSERGRTGVPMTRLIARAPRASVGTSSERRRPPWPSNGRTPARCARALSPHSDYACGAADIVSVPFLHRACQLSSHLIERCELSKSSSPSQPASAFGRKPFAFGSTARRRSMDPTKFHCRCNRPVQPHITHGLHIASVH